MPHGVGEGAGRQGGRTPCTPTLCPPSPRAAEKAQLRSQLDQTALARKELENNCAKGSAELAKTKQEHEGCQQELLRTKTELTATKSQLELPKHECNLLRSEFSIPLQRIRETINPYSCGSTHEELRRLAQRAEDFFLQQKSREAVYQEKVACELNLLQCQFNGTRLKQELEKRLQEADKQLKGGQEEKKKLLAEKEQLSKELGEKSKAALQSNYLKQQLSICEGAKVRGQLGHGDSPRVSSTAAWGGREAGRTQPSLARALLHGHFPALPFYPCVFGPALSPVRFCTATSPRAFFQPCVFYPDIFRPALLPAYFFPVYFFPCTFSRALFPRALFSLAFFLPEFSVLRFCLVPRRTPGRDKLRCHPWTLLPRGAGSPRWPCRARHRSRGVGQGP